MISRLALQSSSKVYYCAVLSYESYAQPPSLSPEILSTEPQEKFPPGKN